MSEETNDLEINRKQKKAIVALLSSATVEEAAEKANLSERTLYRYLNDPVFRLHLNSAEADTIDATTRQLLDLQGDALAAIRDVLNDSEVSPSIRLRAAVAVLDQVLKYRTLRNMEGRLLALEVSQATEGRDVDLWDQAIDNF